MLFAATLPLSASKGLARTSCPLICRTKPENWPGRLSLWSSAQAVAENARIAETVGEQKLHFIGTNTCGVPFAFDRRLRVVAVDEVELEFPAVIAWSFELLLKGRVTEEEADAAMRRDLERGFAKQWTALEALLAKPKSFAYAFAPDHIGSLHAECSVEDRCDEFDARLQLVRKQNPGRRTLFKTLKARGVLR